KPRNSKTNVLVSKSKVIQIVLCYAPTKKAFRIYNRCTRRIIETIHVDFDELTVMASEHNSSGPELHEMTPAIISSGLVPNPPPLTLFVPPLRTDWDILFQPMFDELFTPPPSVDHPAPEVIALIDEVVALVLAASIGSPSSTTVNQDAPSPSNSQTTLETHSPIIPNDVEEDNHDLDVARMNNDLFFGIPIPKNDSEASSSSDVIPTFVHTAAPNSEHVNKWTKDHPLDNIISELERPISTRLQLHEQALFYYYDAFLTSVEPKKYKNALTQACWIEAMQEGLMNLNVLKVWELVTRQKSDGYYFKMDLQGMESSDPESGYSPGGENQNMDERFTREKPEVELYFVNMEYQLADIFTKALGRERIEFLINKLGMRSFTPETLKQLADEAEE
ncbi:retrovirus-related pol polyprotein from transposon TNT 1-94, partial [Tanacetum coccineum]